MASKLRRAAQALTFLSVIAVALPAEAQRARQGAQNRNPTNVNRNVNRNVTVNRDVDVHVWGGKRVHAGRYAWPSGHAYGRRAVGYIMPRPFLNPAYYYTGWRALGLAAPLAGHQWLRYGEDLLLVQVSTARVVDVRYGVFG